MSRFASPAVCALGLFVLLSPACTDKEKEQPSDVPAGDSAQPDTGEVPIVDADGDGHSPLSEGGDDCDDADASVYPGAPEACDGIDTDCDGLADPDLFFLSADGVTTRLDEGADFSRPASPAEITVEGDGSLHFCAAGTWYMALTASGGVIEIEGLGREDTVLDGGGQVTPLTLSGGASVSVSGLTLTHGSAERGGGLRVMNGDASLRDVAVLDNDATDGGGIWVASAAASLSLSDCEISDNRATRRGGGMQLWASPDGLSVTDCVFARNEAEEGGPMYLQDLDAEIASSSFEDNQPGLYLSGGRVDLTGVTVRGGWALSGGGAATVVGNALVFFTDSVVTDNASLNRGGAFHVSNDAQLVLEGTELSDNSATYGGGAFVDGASFRATASILDRNEGEYGAFYVDDGTLILSEGTLLRDSVGRAIYAISPGGYASLVVLNDVTATGNGHGVLWAQYAEVDVSGSSFSGNWANASGNAGSSGGAIAALNSQLDVVDSTFDGNQATGTGGAVLVSHGEFYFDGVSFTNNTAASGGGALWIGQIYTYDIAEGVDCTFSGNSPDDILLQDTLGVWMGDDTTFSYHQ